MNIDIKDTDKYIQDFLQRFKKGLEEAEKREIKFNWQNLKEERCPICHNKLKFTFDGMNAYCKGKKHRKSFYITFDKFSSIVS